MILIRFCLIKEGLILLNLYYLFDCVKILFIFELYKKEDFFFNKIYLWNEFWFNLIDCMKSIKENKENLFWKIYVILK